MCVTGLCAGRASGLYAIEGDQFKQFARPYGRNAGKWNAAMKTNLESEKLSLSECKRILNARGKNYSEEEIIKIRNWIYKFSEITLAFLERKSPAEILELRELLKCKRDNK
jgi:hypothetical protein